MNKTVLTVLEVVEVVVFIAAAIWSAVSGGCSTPLETTSGGTCYMKCYWTFKAATVACIVGVLVAILTLCAKSAEGRRMPAIATIVIAAGTSALTTSFGVGLCASAEMHCHTTANVLCILMLIAAVLGFVLSLKADPEAKKKPKMQL